MDTLKLASLALTLALLAACTGTPPVTPGVDTAALERRAGERAAAGDVAAAASLYADLAAATSGTQRAGHLLESARLAIDAEQLAAAEARLAEVIATGTRDQAQLASTRLARIDVERGRPAAALERLAQLQAPLSDEVLRESAAVRGRALFATGQTAEAVRTLAERELWLNEPDAILANQRLIWEGLGASEAVPQPTGDPLVDGWLALTPLTALTPDSADFRAELLSWRSRYADHPAAGGLLAALVSTQRDSQTQARQIALLLPLGGPQRSAAAAIRDGFMAARFAAGLEMAVRVYDTATMGASEAYLQAQLEGADFIVGPLLRPAVEQVLGESGFVPTLALNFSQTDAPFLNSFYQFALWPEDEARAIAQRAYAEGARTAVAFVASNDWGYRLLNSFRDEFEALGGELLRFSGYDPGVTDFSGPIVEVMNINRSQQRHQRLAANIGRTIEFEPRRRQDVDMIFLAADAAAGRLLVPQLRFHSAGDLPTYATREIHDPAGRAGNADLDGVRFPDAPLLLAPDRAGGELRRAVESFWPDNAGGQLRFYGMGYDAYRLMSALYRFDARDWPVEGFSGRLTLDTQGRIHRLLPFAQFRNGAAVALAPAPDAPPAELPAITAR